MAERLATYDLSLYAPAQGEYTLSVADTDSELFVARDGQLIWNLTTAPFVIDLEQGTNDQYSLIVVRHNAPTDIEGASSSELDGARKVLFNGHMFIIRDGRIYDVTGKDLK